MDLQFSQILKLLRTENNITQQELADHLHVSRSTIAGYESRSKQLDYEKLVLIADYFQVTVDFLLTGEPPSVSKLYTVTMLSNRQLENLLLKTFSNLSYLSKNKLIEYAELLKQHEEIEYMKK